MQRNEQKYKSVPLVRQLSIWLQFLSQRRKKALLCLLLLFENSHKSCPEINLGLRRSGQQSPGKHLQCLLLRNILFFLPPSSPVPPPPRPSDVVPWRAPHPSPPHRAGERMQIAVKRQLKLLIKKPLLGLSESRSCAGGVFSVQP